MTAEIAGAQPHQSVVDAAIAGDNESGENKKERTPTIKFIRYLNILQNNKKHKQVKPPKMDDEQKKLAQARIDKQMVEGFERIFSKRCYKSSKMEDRRKWFRQVRKGK